MSAVHNLVRLGYNSMHVEDMDEDDVTEWLEQAKAYNKATGISGA